MSLSHELALFLQLYNGACWTRNTGIHVHMYVVTKKYKININITCTVYAHLVTGEANFSMDSTNLIIGGFSQPSVARALIEQCGSAEIGLAQRILWLFPQPAYSRFNTLKPVDEKFTNNISKHATYCIASGYSEKDQVCMYSKFKF